MSQNRLFRLKIGESLHQLRGSNQLPLRLRISLQGGGRAIGDMEDIDHLRQKGDLREQRDCLSGKALRLSRPIPMLVKILDAVAHRFREAHAGGNLGTAMASRLDQLAGDFTAVLENIDDGAKALGEAGFKARMTKNEAQGLRQAAVDQLEVALEADVVGQIELTDAGGIAGAAEVLEQQRVIEIRELIWP